jgi:hypothetical protein
MAVQKIVLYADEGLITLEPEGQHAHLEKFDHPDFHYRRWRTGPGRGDKDALKDSAQWDEYEIRWNNKRQETA